MQSKIYQQPVAKALKDIVRIRGCDGYRSWTATNLHQRPTSHGKRFNWSTAQGNVCDKGRKGHKGNQKYHNDFEEKYVISTNNTYLKAHL